MNPISSAARESAGPPSSAVGAPAPTSARAATHEASAHHGDTALGALALAALGVVYGDIGTSPLYALKECVNGPHGVSPTPENVLGLLSLMLWSVILVVSVKYLTFIMRADNQGEGGILALLALMPESKLVSKKGRVGILASLILFGAALLYGDGIITPAISVLSAVEGLEVATDTFKPLVIPITVGILVGLFVVQKRGTTTIGRVFGPIMVLWFGTLAVLGVIAITKHPSVLVAVSPTYAVSFFRDNGSHGFVVLGAVVLCITGGEALYADMGHFGRKPIQVAWYGLVLPALLLNYFGQGALLVAADEVTRPSIAANPFYALVPRGPAIYPLVAVATAATIIASQALISGAFSLTRQGVQLGYLPRVTITHTSSDTEGQIYIPEVNWALAVGCVALVLAFKASTNLAAAYGIAVTGTMGITSVAFFVVARNRWGWSLPAAGSLLVLFLAIDLAFFGANLLKFLDGGFVPIAVGLFIFFTMRVWKRGRALLARYFTRAATPLDEFLDDLGRGELVVRGLAQGSIVAGGVHDEPVLERIPIARVPGVAVFLTSNSSGTPPLLLHHARHNKALHEAVLLVTVTTERIPRVLDEAVRMEELEHGFRRVLVRVGFMETPDVPRALEIAFRKYDLPYQLSTVTYYLGRETLLATSHGEMSRREEQLFAFLTRNSQNATRYFGIPPQRVVEIGMQIDL
ncbi:MAG: KUP/HAK/KT family potassium transporter [Polyangiaceae bacterium]|nr:KUP/HAK/KT family potassium transporter [Polyangiaceae bacterium]MBK8942079.1 KUP/HAK/KT family potassium transporter [Polyangiaceae bacterium]